MKIKTKILWALLGMSLLVALVGALAVNRQRAAAVVGATKEAEDVARVLSYFFISVSNKFSVSAQAIVDKLHQTQGRDVSLMDSHQLILADAIPSEIGKVFMEDSGDEVGATIRDRQVRTFIEVSQEYPAGIKQIVVPVESESGQVIGAVVLEYTPLYHELMHLTRSLVYQVIAAGAGSVAIALLIAFYMGHSIARPLEQLTNVATSFATGRTDLALPPPRKDEIGKLATAFKHMMQKRHQAEVEHERAEAALKQAQRIAHIGSWERDVVQQTVVWSDEQFRLFGFTPGEYAPDYNALFTVVHHDDRELIADFISAVLATKKPAEMECRVVHPNGEVRILHSRADVVLDDSGNVLRMVGTSQDITERKRAEVELEKVHKELVGASHQAGMAEVATGVLHNVGNVLNSVNISTGVIMESVRKSRTSGLARIVVLLQEHAHDLGAFLTNDSRGKHVPALLAQLSEYLMGEQEAMGRELDSLRRNIEHIKEIVAMQQNYATFGGVKEMINVVNLVEDSLRMNEGALSRHHIEIIREFENVPPLNAEKHKILQILVNLMRNAKYACQESDRVDKRLTVRVANGDGRVNISVIDNGIGIPPENLTRIFNHGFTTRKDGHGFGLHTSVLAAKEVGGSLTVHSNGSDQGAVFTLELPCPTKENSHE